MVYVRLKSGYWFAYKAGKPVYVVLFPYNSPNVREYGFYSKEAAEAASKGFGDV